MMKENPIKANILHVDDDLSFLDLTKQYLIKLSNEIIYEIEINLLDDPIKARSLIKSKQFDLIILDYDMPNLNGIELLKELRKNKIKIPIILFTGRGREEIVIQALNYGANYYIEKGIDVLSQYRQLISAINIILKQKLFEDTLKSHQNIYERVVTNLPQLILNLSLEGKIQLQNKSLVNYNEKKMLGKLFLDFIKPKFKYTVETFFKQTIAEKRKISVEFDTIVGDTIDCQLIPILEENQVIEVLAIFDLITEQKAVEQEVQELIKLIESKEEIKINTSNNMSIYNDNKRIKGSNSKDFKLIQHKGKEIIFLDFKGKSEELLIKSIKNYTGFILNYIEKNPNKRVLTLVDMSDTVLTTRIQTD